MQAETFLPCFPGFYGTLFEFENEDKELENINDKRAEIGLNPIGYDDVKWSYKDYHINVSKKAVGYIEQKLNELGIECKLVFKELKSPREYNFSTDMIIIDAEFDPEQVRGKFFENCASPIAEFLRQFLPKDGFAPFESTVKKGSVGYWKKTSFDNFHDFGLACELVLNSHGDSEFNMDEFAEQSTHEVEVGIENYSDLIKCRVDIDEWNLHNSYMKYPAQLKWNVNDPDVPFDALPYKPGDVVFCKDKNDYAVVLGAIDGHREELRVDLCGMVSFSDIRQADANDVDDMKQRRYGKQIIDFLKQD